MPDLLTGLPSHRDLDPSVASGEPLALLVDIDSFTWLNDQFGHEVGDQALVTLAAEPTRIFKSLALTRIFRVAGDTFLVVLPGPEVDAVDAVSRVIEGIAELNIPYRRLDRPERTRLEVNVVILRLTSQRFSQCFGRTGVAEIYNEFFSEFVYREKLRHGGRQARRSGRRALICAVFDKRLAGTRKTTSDKPDGPLPGQCARLRRARVTQAVCLASAARFLPRDRDRPLETLDCLDASAPS